MNGGGAMAGEVRCVRHQPNCDQPLCLQVSVSHCCLIRVTAFTTAFTTVMIIASMPVAVGFVLIFDPMKILRVRVMLCQSIAR